MAGSAWNDEVRQARADAYGVISRLMMGGARGLDVEVLEEARAMT